MKDTMDTTTDTTLTTTSETVPAAPATSAPASEPVVSQRPATARAAFAQVTADPPPDASASPDAAATGQDGQTGATHPSAEKKGPIPFEVHAKALENARLKAVEEAQQAWIEKELKPIEWAKGVNREHVATMERMGQLYASDKAAFFRQLFAESLADTGVAPLLRSEAARVLGARPAASEAVELEPDIPVQDASGNVVNATFSGKRVMEILAPLKAEIATLKQQLGPLQQDHQTRAEREAADAKAKADQALIDRHTARIKSTVFTLPHAEAHKDAIVAKAKELIQGDAEMTAPEAMHLAYAAVVTPKLEALSKASALDSFSTKAAGQTIDGSGRAASTPTRPKNPAELAAFMRQLVGR